MIEANIALGQRIQDLEAENARLAFQLEVATVLPANAEAYEADIRHLREELQRYSKGWMEASAENAALKAEVQRLSRVLKLYEESGFRHSLTGGYVARSGIRYYPADACICNTCDACLDRHREDD